jgi:hypothetical protein
MNKMEILATLVFEVSYEYINKAFDPEGPRPLSYEFN